MSKVGIYGGTFDPIHIGHLITTQSVLEQRQLDKIIFIPCFISPHKQTIISSSEIHRLNMLKLALAENPKFDFSTYEIDRKGISYSIDTIKEIKKYYDEIDLIIGYDNLLVFETWKEPDEIIKLVNLVVLKRIFNKSNSWNRFFENAIFLETPTIEISSSQIRERVKKNLSIDYLVPSQVNEYIKQYKLYAEN